MVTETGKVQWTRKLGYPRRTRRNSPGSQLAAS